MLSGRAAMIVDGEEAMAGAGDMVVIGPATPHRFTAIGACRLAMLRVHASDRVVIDAPATDSGRT